MTAIRTSQQNAYEGTLASEMGPNDLTVIVDGIGTLTTPCYLVIEMDSYSQREYIFFDGAFTSTTFVTTNIAKRYLPGSAAGSNLTHPAGTKIRTYVGKQQHDDLHDRIDGLSHDDLANINANNHHTKYTDAEAAAKIAADDLYVPRAEFDFVAARMHDIFVENFSTRIRTESVELAIPSGWSTYDVEAWATISVVVAEESTLFFMLVNLDI